MKTFALPAASRLKLTTSSACSVDGCGRPVRWSCLCATHYNRKTKTGSPGGPIRPRATNGQGHKSARGYVVRTVDGRKRTEHILLAEKAIGKPLPHGAEVHHIDENKANNSPSNLVICPSAAYHKLLHQRQRAFDACGHYHWRKCSICGVYDDPSNGMWMNNKVARHLACQAEARRTMKKGKK